MRMTISALMASLVLGASPLIVAGQAKYGVTVNTVETAGLAKAKTYGWTTSHPALDKNIDKMIVAAVDRELGLRGLTKVTSGKSDVVVTYSSLSRTDVDLKAKPKDGAYPESLVGTIVVDINAAGSKQLLFRVRTDTPMKIDPATYETVVNGAVAAIFEKYPTPAKR